MTPQKNSPWGLTTVSVFYLGFAKEMAENAMSVIMYLLATWHYVVQLAYDLQVEQACYKRYTLYVVHKMIGNFFYISLTVDLELCLHNNQRSALKAN
jgi:hypothetical protein